MSNITVHQTSDITDPQLLAIAQRVLAIFCLSAEKAVCHFSEPAVYPMPAGSGSIEHLLLERFQSLKSPIQQKAVANTKALLHASSQERAARYQDLANVDPRSRTSIAEQAHLLGIPGALKIPLGHLPNLRSAQPAPTTVRSGTVPSLLTDRLWLRVLKVECVNQTGDWGEDEIYLSGTAIDSTGNVAPIGPHRVGDFEDGDHIDYPDPWRIAECDLSNMISNESRQFRGTLILFEHDNGNLSEFENRLYEKAKELTQKYLQEAVSAATAEFGPVLSELMGELTAWIVGKLFDWFRSIWEDEVFPPITVECFIPWRDIRFEDHKNHCTPLRLRWKGYGGEYLVWIDFRVRWSDEPLSLCESLGQKFDLTKGIRAAGPLDSGGGISIRTFVENIEE